MAGRGVNLAPGVANIFSGVSLPFKDEAGIPVCAAKTPAGKNVGMQLHSISFCDDYQQ